MAFKSSATTHVGMVRKLNEDAYAERSDIGVWVVADGMGGHEAGEVASGMITDYIKNLNHAEGFEAVFHSVKTSIEAANSELVAQSSAYDAQRVPGSTVVALVINGTQGAVLWCGDSRIYRRRDRILQQLTRDHSHVQDLVDQDIIKAEDAESHPMANVITRAVGINEPLELDYELMDVIQDDQFLLCSDGLSRLASHEEIESMMANRDSEEVTQSLLHTALVRGAPDNVTLICVKDCDDEDHYSSDDESTVSLDTATLDDFE
jgi:serine/threonine-protein phosphatase Stp1